MTRSKTRLCLYLLLSFGLAFLWFVISNPSRTKWDDLSYEMQSFVSLGMLFPMIAHVLTRGITKEGFSPVGENSMMLGISFGEGKWKYYLCALLLPWLYTELGNLITLLLCPKAFDPQYYQALDIEKRLLFLLPANAFVTGIVASFAAFGEEGGWRGYMMPKLQEIFGKGRAIVIGGVLWGLWHAPLTCIGHNFGTDYFGFPYLGIFEMCIFCTLMGILLTFLTEKSGSVWPAAFMHAVNNAGPSILNGYINPDKTGTVLGMNASWVGRMASMVLVVIVILILWHRSDRMEQ